MRIVLMSDNQGKAPEGWGSHLMFKWSEWEPRRGVFDYALVERALNARARRCYLQIGVCAYDKKLKAPQDYTPSHQQRSIALTAASGVTGFVPDYSAAWVDAYIEATRAMAERFKGHPNLAGFWAALGWNQECIPAINNAGGQWGDLLKPKLAEATFIDFILRYGRASCAAWDPTPVYLPAAPSPAALWSHRRRDVIATLLEEGCGYMNCGLVVDIQNSFGVGEHAGTGMYDIVIERTARRGFEEGPRKAVKDPNELYWMALRAWYWDAEYLSVYSSISAPQMAQVAPLLPRTARSHVWRDSEYPPITWTGADKKIYGSQGEPGCWAKGLLWRTGGRLFLDATRYDFGRWQLISPDAIQMEAPGLPDGRYRVTVYAPPTQQSELVVEARGGIFDLPAGTYHRIDLHEPALVEPQPEPLPNDEAVATPEKVRWWIEELQRERERENAARADAILESLIDLAYRLEGVERPNPSN